MEQREVSLWIQGKDPCPGSLSLRPSIAMPFICTHICKTNMYIYFYMYTKMYVYIWDWIRSDFQTPRADLKLEAIPSRCWEIKSNTTFERKCGFPKESEFKEKGEFKIVTILCWIRSHSRRRTIGCVAFNRTSFYFRWYQYQPSGLDGERKFLPRSLPMVWVDHSVR